MQNLQTLLNRFKSFKVPRHFLLLALVLTVLPKLGLHAQAEMFISPDTSIVGLNDVFTVDVEIRTNNANQQIDGGEVHLNFDPNVLQVVSLTPGTQLPVPLLSASFDNTNGFVDYAAGALFQPFPFAPLTLLEIEFRAISDPGSAGTSFSYEFTIPQRNTAVTFGGSGILDTTISGVVLIGQVVDPCAGVVPDKDTIFADICNGEVLVLNGVSYSTPGTFNDTLVSSSTGCDSLIQTLVLSVNPTFSTSATASICQGESFQFGTQLLTTAGSFTETFQSQDGCDSVVTLSLVVLPSSNTSISEEICQGESFQLGGQVLTTSGIFSETFVGANGCDSTVTLTLTVNPTFNTTATAEVCDGDAFQFGTQNLTVGGTFTETFLSANGCDSTVTLTLTVNPTFETNITEEICDGESFTFGAQTLTASGTYTETFSTTNGCDSVVTLTLTVNPTFDETLSIQICQGDSIEFAGVTYNTTTVVSETFTTASGCDSLVTLNLTVVPQITVTLDETICDNESFLFDGQNLTVAGTYTATFGSQAGCDSVVVLNLMVNPSFSQTVSATICDGESFLFGTQNLNTSGTFTETFTSVNGCDSIVTLNLIVNPTFSTNVSLSICDDETFQFGTQTLNVAGTYTETFIASNGCDSVVTLDLNVNPTFNETLDVQICQGDSFEFAGVIYSSNTTVTETFTSAVGCDSMVTLNLTVVPQINVSLNESICDNESFSFDGQVLTAAGTYTATFPSQAGCDSVVTLNLTVSPTFNTNVSAEICDNESFPFGTQNLTAAGIYTETFAASNGCDSTVSLTLTVNPTFNQVIDTTIDQGQSIFFNGQTLTTSGTFVANLQTVNGCDSVVTLNLTVNPISSGLNAPSNLVVRGDSAFLAPMTWQDNSSNEDGFEIYRNGTLLATVGPNVTSYEDTLAFFGAFGVVWTYEVRAFNTNQTSGFSNQDTYEMPQKFKLLRIAFDCYDSNGDSIQWKVFNPNQQWHPAIWAQWWSPQRDTLWAAPNNVPTYFKSKNNPQLGSTLGDDNITGVWWADESLQPGMPFSLFFRFHIPLRPACAALRTAPQLQSRGGNSGDAKGIYNIPSLRREISFPQAVAYMLAEELNVYPNPVEDLLTIEGDGIIKDAAVSLYNMMGQEVYRSLENVDGNIELDMSGLAKGVYTMKVEMNEVTLIKKITKN